jgi:serine/threonine protein kinase
VSPVPPVPGAEPNTAPPPTTSPLAPLEEVGRWTVVRAIREGGTGAVYEARPTSAADAESRSRVAIKVLLGNWVEKDAAFERFAREAKILERLTSPHTCRLLEVGNLGRAKGKLPYLVLEYLDGVDLGDVRTTRGRVPWHEAARWIADACIAIAEAHELGIVHRDLKPSNLFLARGADGNDLVKVLDFGVAKAIDTVPVSTAITQPGTIVGTLQYMSPEQLSHPGEVSPPSDIWSLGAILHELVTGTPAFPGESGLAICSAILMRPLPEIRSVDADLPEALEQVLQRCLTRAAGDRYTIRELEAALRALA